MQNLIKDIKTLLNPNIHYEGSVNYPTKEDALEQLITTYVIDVAVDFRTEAENLRKQREAHRLKRNKFENALIYILNNNPSLWISSIIKQALKK